MRKHLILGIAVAAGAAILAAPQAGIAQTQAPTGTPAPGQAGDDPSMAPPAVSPKEVLPPEKVNPESTVGLAPSDQPVNNAKPRVAGQVVPSSEETAAHTPSIFEHDRLPTISHTFNFTDEQKKQILAALAQNDRAQGNQGKDSGAGLPKDGVAESVVLPASVKVNPLPEALVAQMPWVRNYGYATDGTRVVLVDPYLRFVAAIIE
jgi:hypothetical protein